MDLPSGEVHTFDTFICGILIDMKLGYIGLGRISEGPHSKVVQAPLIFFPDKQKGCK